MILRFLHAVGLILGDAISTMVEQRRWKLLPAFFVFLGLSAALVLVKAISPIAPFVYSLF